MKHTVRNPVARKPTAFVLGLAVLALAVAATTGPALAGDGKACDRSKSHAAADAAKDGRHVQHDVAERARHGWLGVETGKAANGYVITAVHDGSPAADAGFRSGDVLVALNGIRLTADNKEELKAAKKALRPGSRVDYTIERKGAERTIAATLAPVPDAVLAQWEAEAAEAKAAQQLAANDN